MKFLKPASPLARHKNTRRKPWKVAIIDDEQQVHAVTQMVLKNTQVDEQPITFFNAYSAEEGLRLFQDHPDIARDLSHFAQAPKLPPVIERRLNGYLFNMGIVAVNNESRLSPLDPRKQ